MSRVKLQIAFLFEHILKRKKRLFVRWKTQRQISNDFFIFLIWAKNGNIKMTKKTGSAFTFDRKMIEMSL